MKHTITLCLLALVILRIIGWIFMIDYPEENLYPLENYDPIAQKIKLHSHQYDSFFLASLIFFCMYIFAINYKMYFTKADHLIWQDLNSLVIQSYDAYVKSKKSQTEIKQICVNMQNKKFMKLNRSDWCLFIPKTFLKLYSYFYVKLKLWSSLDYINLNVFLRCKLILFKSLSAQNRIKYLKWMLLFKYSNLFTLVSIGKLVVLYKKLILIKTFCDYFNSNLFNLLFHIVFKLFCSNVSPLVLSVFDV